MLHTTETATSSDHFGLWLVCPFTLPFFLCSMQNFACGIWFNRKAEFPNLAFFTNSCWNWKFPDSIKSMKQHKPTLIWITKVPNLFKSLTHGGWTSWHSVYSKPYTCPKLPDTHRISIWLQCYLNVLNLFFSQWPGLCYFICHLLCSIFKLHVVKSRHQASSLSTVISGGRGRGVVIPMPPNVGFV